jgi:hypothetical protein
MKAWTDRSRFWLVTLAAALTAALTFSLGQWQLDRASQKLALQSSLEQKKSLPVLGNADMSALTARDAASAAALADRLEARGIRVVRPDELLHRIRRERAAAGR